MIKNPSEGSDNKANFKEENRVLGSRIIKRSLIPFLSRPIMRSEIEIHTMISEPSNAELEETSIEELLFLKRR
jgi:hypothetical protein